jgi:hypothetical protein
MRLGATVLGAGSLLVLSACASNAPTSDTHLTRPAPSATRMPTATSTSPAALAGQQAVEAYLEMWHDMVVAGTTSNWQDPQLGQYATGDALQVITKSLYTDHLNGVVTKGSPTNSPRVSSIDSPIDPTTVTIKDCGDDSGWLKYKTDGQLFNDVPGGHRSITAQVKKQPDGSWRVTDFAVEGVGSCAS